MPERFECTTLAKNALYKYSSFPYFPLPVFTGRVDGPCSRWTGDREHGLRTRVSRMKPVLDTGVITGREHGWCVPSTRRSVTDQ